MNNLLPFPAHRHLRFNALRWFDVRIGAGGVVAVLFDLDGPPIDHAADHDNLHEEAEQQQCHEDPSKGDDRAVD